MTLLQQIEAIAPLNQTALQEAQERWNSLAKPLGSLGTLEKQLVQIAGICGTARVALNTPVVVVFCADNGVVQQGVTQADSSVTAIVAENMTRGTSSVCLMGAQIGARILPVDIGIVCDLPVVGLRNCKVRHGTADFTQEPAMTRGEVEQAIAVGMTLAKEQQEAGASLLITGEMGIGNTTTAAALSAVLLGLSVDTVTGRGAGLSDAGLVRKRDAVTRGIALHQPNPQDPLDVLAKLGGLDIAGMVGLCLGGARYRIPVVLDGMISVVAALLATRFAPACRDYLLPSHVSAEPAGQHVLAALNMQAPLHADLCLGEGTGGVATVALLQMALRVYDSMASFEAIGVEAYTPQTGV